MELRTRPTVPADLEPDGFSFSLHERPLTFNLQSGTYELKDGEAHLYCPLCGADYAAPAIDYDLDPDNLPEAPTRVPHQWCFWDHQRTHSH